MAVHDALIFWSLVFVQNERQEVEKMLRNVVRTQCFISEKKSQGFKEFAKAILQGVAFVRCNTVFCSKNSFIDCISVCQCISPVWVDVIAFALAPTTQVPHGHSRTADRGSVHCARLQNLRWSGAPATATQLPEVGKPGHARGIDIDDLSVHMMFIMLFILLLFICFHLVLILIRLLDIYYLPPRFGGQPW